MLAMNAVTPTRSLLESHILYTEHDTVQSICAPLQHLGLDGFIFMRRFHNGSLIDLSTNLEWSTFFFERYYSEIYPVESIKDHIFISEGVSLWSMNEDNIVWQEGAGIFGFNSGINICEHHDKYDDIFCYYKKYDANELSGMHKSEFYLSKLNLLKKFNHYFINQAQALIQKGSRNRLYTLSV